MKRENILTCIFVFFSISIFAQRPAFLKKDSIRSKLDDSVQVFYFDKSSVPKPQPLVVELHSWSNTSHSQAEILAESAHNMGFNYILPNFRGVNNHVKACCSEYVIADIDEAIDWALKNMNVDKKRIYAIGNSGGGLATLAMYMKSKHEINTFSAWSSISDLRKWYDESVERKNRYGPEILKCIGSEKPIENQKAWDRSPLFWDTPVKKRKNAKLQIFAGIHDGYTGSVPISHSIDFYNKLLFDFHEKDNERYVSEDESNEMLNTRNFVRSGVVQTIDGRKIHFRKSSKNISINIFEGGHEILNNVALDLLNK